VHHYLDQIPPALASQVKVFFAQEGRHAQAHERLFQTLRAQGYDVDSILEPYERIAFDYVEKALPPALRLSVTAAAEHFTALMAEDALTLGLLVKADPEVRRLLEWHAVEELEHKAVAFDVLAEVAPSYPLRVAGMLVGATALGAFWLLATRELLKQDGSSLLEARRELNALRKQIVARGGARAARPIGTSVFLRGIRRYLRRDFHPADRDHSNLIARTLARLANEGVIEASAP
jgi:predicted metal-dependent hydrolase